MKVALGTYELSEEDRKAIKKTLGFRGGKASRVEAKDFLLEAVEGSLAVLHSPPAEEPAEADSDEQA